MRIVAVLSHFAESPTMLAACVSSLTKLGVDHLVAVDGAYALMPGGKGSSGIEQTRVITDVASATGIGLTLHHLAHPSKYRGNEVGKRNVALSLALATSTSEDWLFIIDADEVVDVVRGDVRGLLASTELDAGIYSLTQRIDPLRSEEDEFVSRCAGGLESRTPIVGFIRALPGLRYEANHYTILDGERVLCPASPLSVDAEDLTSMVRLEHHKHLRDPYRAEQARAFYSARDTAVIEHVHPPLMPVPA